MLCLNVSLCRLDHFITVVAIGLAFVKISHVHEKRVTFHTPCRYYQIKLRGVLSLQTLVTRPDYPQNYTSHRESRIKILEWTSTTKRGEVVWASHKPKNRDLFQWSDSKAIGIDPPDEEAVNARILSKTVKSIFRIQTPDGRAFYDWMSQIKPNYPSTEATALTCNPSHMKAFH